MAVAVGAGAGAGAGPGAGAAGVAVVVVAAAVVAAAVAAVLGLLTGFPPFITAGSFVLLLGGTPAGFGVSPMSCSDGSLYIATVEGEHDRMT